MKMIIHNVEQGTQEWLDLRMSHFTASDAPAMMGSCKYKSRQQLLHEKKTGQTKPVSAKQQEIFDAGHKAEADARQILELEMLEDFPPVVGSIELDVLPLLASFDGLGSTVWEHKLHNATLAENVRNGILEPHYYWQLEHQLLVAGIDEALFVTSDGTENNRETMTYVSQPERREQLIAGWKLFAEDLDKYQPKAKAEKVVVEEAEAFPLVTFEVQGSSIISNITEVLPAIKERAEVEMSRILETDKDFAEKENLNKATKKARATLKAVVGDVKTQFVSFSVFEETARQIDSILQKMQSHGEKLVKDEKARRKLDIVAKADKALQEHIESYNQKIAPLVVYQVLPSIRPDFETAMKGKRNLESMTNAVDAVLLKAKVDVDLAMEMVMQNQSWLRENAKKYGFLFSDVAQLVNQPPESFEAVARLRIAEHKEQEQKRREAEREAIRVEEELKAKREAEARAEAERLEKERADREAAAKERADREAAEREAAEESQPEPMLEPEPEPAPEHEHATVTPISAAKHAPLTFAEEMASWAEIFEIPLEATMALSQIMKRHGMLQAS